MSFVQRIKIWLTPFNPILYNGALPDPPDTIADISTWTISDCNGSLGAQSLTGNHCTTDHIGMLIKFSNHNKVYKITDYSGGSPGTITIGEPLEMAVSSIDAQVYQWADITDLQISVSNIEKEIEFTRDEPIADMQLRFNCVNKDGEFYNRDAFTTAYNTAQAFLNTHNETESERDYKYVRIEMYYNSQWNQIYSGKICDDSININVSEQEIAFEAESILYESKDTLMGSVENIYNGHDYTSDEKKTQTISGKIIDIIVKCMLEFSGINKRTLTSVSYVIDGNKMTLTKDNHGIREGEHITFSCPDYGLSGGFIATNVTTNTLDVKLRRGNILSVLTDDDGTITANGIIFDSAESYFDVVHKNWSYTIEDIYFICPLWHSFAINEMTIWEFLIITTKWFNSYFDIDYIGGVPYGFYKSKNRQLTPIITLTNKDHIIEKANITANFKDYSLLPIIAKNEIELFDGSTHSENIQANYNTDYGKILVASVAEKGVYGVLCGWQGEQDSSLDDAIQIGDWIQFGNHDTKYRVTSNTDGVLTLNQALTQSVHANETVIIVSGEVDIDYTDCVFIKLVYPDIYYCNKDEEQVVRLSNINNEESIFGYYDAEIVPSLFAQDVEDIALFDWLPVLRTAGDGDPEDYGKIEKHGSSLICFHNNGSSNKEINHGSIWWAKPYTTVRNIDYGVNVKYFSSGWAQQYDKNDKEIKYFPIVLYDQSSVFSLIHRFKLEYISDNDSSETGNKHEFSVYACEKDGSDKGFVNTFGFIKGIAFNADILSPFKNDYVYFTVKDTDDSKLYLYSIPIFDTKNNFIDSTSGDKPEIDVNAITLDCGNYSEDVFKIIFTCATDQKVYTISPTGDWGDVEAIAGGGATSLVQGESCLTTEILFTNLHGVHKCYDKMIAVSDSDENKIYLIDLICGVVYCVADNSTPDNTGYSACNNPKGVRCIDFVNYWDMVKFDLTNNELLSNDEFKVDIAYESLKNRKVLYSTRRREIQICLDYEEYIEYEFKLGDRLILDTSLICGDSGNTIFWIKKIILDLKELTINLTLLEDKAV